MRTIYLVLLTAGGVFGGTWTWSNPSPMGGEFSDVHLFSGGDEMYIVGNFQNLLRYDESAHPEWVVMEPPESPFWYRTVTFLNQQNGYLAGEPFNVFRTFNGGKNWISIYTSPQRRKAVWDMEFCEEVHGYVAGGGKAKTLGDPGLIAVTHDGGDSWTEVSTQYTIRSIEVLDPQNALAAGDCGTLLRTSDGGITWNAVPTPAGSDVHFLDMYCISKDIILLVGGRIQMGGLSRIIYRSDDGGLNWDNPLFPMGSELNSICFADDNTGFAVGSMLSYTPSMLRTDDGGLNWYSVESGATLHLEEIKYNGSGIWVTVGHGGQVLRSSDNGCSWEFLNHSETDAILHSVDFSSTTGIVSGKGGTALTTSDGGESWTSVQLPSDHHMFGALAVDQQNLITVGGLINSRLQEGSILHSPDGGASWNCAFSSSYMFYDVDHIEETSIAVAVGRRGQLVKSINSGRDWRSVSSHSMSDIHLRRVSFPDQTTGYAVGSSATTNDSRIIKSVDCGESWSVIPSPLSGVAHVVDFYSATTGIAGDEEEDVYITDDGGLSWTRILDFEEEVDLVYGMMVDHSTIIVMFKGPGNGYVPPNNISFFCCSIDGGATWKTCPCPLFWPLEFHYDPAADLMTVVGVFGEIRQKDDFLGDMYLYGTNDLPFTSEPVSSRSGCSGLISGGDDSFRIQVSNPSIGSVSAVISNNTTTGQIVECRLYSIDGRVIDSASLRVETGSSQRMNLFEVSSSIPAGSYILHMEYEGGHDSVRLILLP